MQCPCLNPFTKYILCEQDPERFEALKKRVERDYNHLNYELLLGDSNQNIEAVIKSIPSFKKGNTLLPFCFVDPFSLDLEFYYNSKAGQKPNGLSYSSGITYGCKQKF